MEEVLEIRETTQEILDYLQSIKPKYKDVLLLRGLQQLSSAETAEVLGWTTTRVNVTYHRAIRAAKDHFYHDERGAMGSE
jgi:RNA polymerase sigma-70 factor (ECF subfamily)